MARMIDGDVLTERLRGWLESPHGENVYNSGYDDAIWHVLDVIEHMPTLTQPNEPLTLDELGEMSYTDWVWLEFPREKPSDNCWERGWKAYRLYSHERYGVSWIAYRRPPEGEEEEKHVIEITENL